MGKKRPLAQRLSTLLIAAVIAAGAASAQQTGKLLFPDETDSQVLQWGADTVHDFLAFHRIPESELTSINLYARQDLRDNIRAFAWSKLQVILRDPSADLDATTERLLAIFAENVKLTGSEALKIAVQEKDSFLANRCTWRPDAELSKSAGFTYDGTYHCPRTPYSPTFSENPPLSPPKDYFVALGQKKSWLEKLAGRPGGMRSMVHITQAGGIYLAIGFAAAAGLGALLPFLMSGSAYFLTSKVVQYVLKTGEVFSDVVPAVRGVGQWVGVGITIAVLLMMVTIVVVLETENSRIEAEYGQLDTQLAAAMTQPAPTRDRLAFAINSRTDQLTLYATFLRMSIPTTWPPTPAALPTPTSADPVFLVRQSGSPTATQTAAIVFPGWDGEKTRARLWRGWILQEALAALPNIDLTSLNTRIRFLWSGKKYEASRLGGTFAVKKVSPANDDIDCPMDRATLVSAPADINRCKTFVTRELPMDIDGVGTRIVSITQPLSFTSASSAKVAVGQAFSIPVTTAGLPEAAISANGSLPAGFSLDAGAFPGTANLEWNGAGAVGTYDITLIANNGVESKQATIQVAVADSVRFTAPAQTAYTYPAGTYVSIPVVATGYPTPTVHFQPFTTSCGLQLQQESGSAYRLSGYVQPAPSPFRCFFHFEATNANAFDLSNPARGRANLDMTIDVTDALAQPYLTTRQFITPAGLPRQYRVETQGATGPVAISLTTDASGNQIAPSWVYLRDEGNGTATLSVYPPLDAPELVSIPVWYRVKGTLGNHARNPNDALVLRVAKKPLFVYSRGEIGRFDVNSPVDQYYGAQAQVDGAVSLEFRPGLPAGLQFSQQNYGAFTISGRATTPGEYDVDVVATNAYGSSTGRIRIIVAQAAKITSPPMVNFYLGRPNRFEITASGFPRAPLSEPGRAVPDPMKIGATQQQMNLLGLLPLTLETQDPVTMEPYYGRAVLTGTPILTGKWPFIISAETAGLPADTQYMILVLTQYGDVNSDLSVNCGDVSFITSRIGRRRGSPQYDHNADINQDGVIDVRDLSLVSSRMPSGTRCQ